VIQIDERSQVLGRRAPTTLGVTGSVRPTLALLFGKVAPKADGLFWDLVTRERRKWNEMLDRQSGLRRSKDELHPQTVARAAGRTRPPRCYLRSRHRPQHAVVGQLDPPDRLAADCRLLQQCGVGTALGQADGVQALDRSRQVIALIGDGGFNMPMGEFLTAVQHKLPVKVVVYNNSALGQITLEAYSVSRRSAGRSNFPIRTSPWRARAAVTALWPEIRRN
jgi:thiamine pyrophosphate-dependent acetolactate synthase large subunit-like protein